jgi:glycosyltransferase involved in cell wall biosynthesis
MTEQSTPLVSIITISYNAGKHIKGAIESVLGQTYPHIEYIVIDGGSSDNTVEVIRQYESKLAYWISEPDNGISDAFNKGLKMAKGEIIGLINADDWYEPDTVQTIVQIIQSSDIAYGDLHLYKGNRSDFILKGSHRLLDKTMSVNHPTVFVKKEVYGKFGVFDEKYQCAMDYDLMLRFKVNNCSFVYIPKVLANMRWEGASDKNWLLGCRETLWIKNHYYPSRKVGNFLYFLKHVAAIALPKYLESLNLHFIIKGYRKRFSVQKKIYK